MPLYESHVRVALYFKSEPWPVTGALDKSIAKFFLVALLFPSGIRCKITVFERVKSAAAPQKWEERNCPPIFSSHFQCFVHILTERGPGIAEYF